MPMLAALSEFASSCFLLEMMIAEGQHGTRWSPSAILPVKFLACSLNCWVVGFGHSRRLCKHPDCPGNTVLLCDASLESVRLTLLPSPLQELQHTSATLAAMETSDTTLKAANKQYKAQRGTIKQSHGLLRTMRVNSIKDNLKLYTALAFFTAVVAYVGLRRMSYFVPSALVPSMPSLAAFGIGSAKGNSTAEFPAFDGQAFDTSEKQPNGASMGSAGGMRSFQSRLMWIQRQAGRFLGQATHHGRRLIAWLYGQTAKAIDSIKAKIEERQRKQQEKGAGTEGKLPWYRMCVDCNTMMTCDKFQPQILKDNKETD